MLCKICTVQILSRKPVQDDAGSTASNPATWARSCRSCRSYRSYRSCWSGIYLPWKISRSWTEKRSSVWNRSSVRRCGYLHGLHALPLLKHVDQTALCRVLGRCASTKLITPPKGLVWTPTQAIHVWMWMCGQTMCKRTSNSKFIQRANIYVGKWNVNAKCTGIRLRKKKKKTRRVCYTLILNLWCLDAVPCEGSTCIAWYGQLGCCAIIGLFDRLRNAAVAWKDSRLIEPLIKYLLANQSA